MPHGSVRAFLALSVAGSAYWLLAHPTSLESRALPTHLGAALPIALGYYFAHRSAVSSPLATRSGPSPLWLPAGSIRVLLVLGFVVAAGFHVAGVFGAHQGFAGLAPILGELGLFFVGQLWKALSSRLKQNEARVGVVRRLGDVSALIGVLSGVGLVLVHCVPSLPVPENVRAVFARAFPLVIAFYFGAR